MKRILLPYGEITRIAQITGVSRQTVSSALKFITKSERAERIRNLATVRGGEIFQPTKIGQS